MIVQDTYSCCLDVDSLVRTLEISCALWAGMECEAMMAVGDLNMFSSERALCGESEVSSKLLCSINVEIQSRRDNTIFAVSVVSQCKYIELLSYSLICLV